jgi:hypothetical protein
LGHHHHPLGWLLVCGDAHARQIDPRPLLQEGLHRHRLPCPSVQVPHRLLLLLQTQTREILLLLGLQLAHRQPRRQIRFNSDAMHGLHGKPPGCCRDHAAFLPNARVCRGKETKIDRQTHGSPGGRAQHLRLRCRRQSLRLDIGGRGHGRHAHRERLHRRRLLGVVLLQRLQLCG